jgi:uridine kinase
MPSRIRRSSTTVASGISATPTSKRIGGTRFESRIDEETLSLEGVQAVIAEGVYTSLCNYVDCRVFIARNRLETLEHRMRRGREEFDPFIEEVLVAEHEIISQHRDRADVVITRDYDVEFVGG